MSQKRPVVVYGASGYTGRIVCEFLRDLQLPFIAAGRDKARIEAALDKVPGIETADHEVAVVPHETDALARLFEGSRVVCNTVGPFELYGETVVKACLQAGVHYLDTTGEQQFVLPIARDYGAAFAKAGLLLAPSAAYMHTTLDIAVCHALENPGIHSIHAVCAATGIPTYGSTQTVVRVARAEEFFVKARKLVPWPRGRSYEVQVPLWPESQLALPWSGTALPVWYQDHPQLENLKVLVTFADNRVLMEQVVGLVKGFDEQLRDLPREEQEKALTGIAESIQPGMPPRENRMVHRNLDFVVGYGPTAHVEVRVHSNCAYQQTGLIQAFCAAQLVHGRPRAGGFQSPCQAFGHRGLLGLLREYGYAELEQV
ncbi:MAG: DUF5938 domain-containing protein [Deltaproteobacteria bacterium]|nr:DUF5938 domain-containing protein [Deltaproteobacteria bacterium]